MLPELGDAGGEDDAVALLAPTLFVESQDAPAESLGLAGMAGIEDLGRCAAVSSVSVRGVTGPVSSGRPMLRERIQARPGRTAPAASGAGPVLAGRGGAENDGQ